MDTCNKLEEMSGGVFLDSGESIYEVDHTSITCRMVQNDKGEQYPVAIKQTLVSLLNTNELTISRKLGTADQEYFVYFYGGYVETPDWLIMNGVRQTPVTKPVLFMVMEYIPMDLKSLISDKHANSQSFSPEQTADLVEGIVRATAWMHVSGIIHCDIKSANILVQNYKPKLCDFGLSRTAGSAPFAGGTLGYMAPEVHTLGCNRQSDIFSVGMVILETLLPKPVDAMFSAINDMRPVSRDKESTGRFYCQIEKEIAAVPTLSREAKRLVNACISPEYSCRPTAEELSKRILFFRQQSNDIALQSSKTEQPLIRV